MLFVLDLVVNLLCIYQITHTSSIKRVTFTQEDVEISEVSTAKWLQWVLQIMSQGCTSFHTFFLNPKGMGSYHMPTRPEIYAMIGFYASTM